MPFTRAMSSTSTESLNDLLDKKFEEWRNDIATKQCIVDLKNIILKQNEKIERLESHVAILQNSVSLLQHSQEEQEQYSKRLCLRIDGIKPTENENSDECLNKVKDVFSILDVDIPENVIDRAHRVGKPYTNHKNQKCHAMIVRFTTWRHRTKVYPAHDKSNNANVKIRLDLTKSRYSILKEALNKLIDGNGKMTAIGANGPVNFVFADINCRLVAKMKDNSYEYFDLTKTFNKIIELLTC